jgi:hypothetical protein
MNSIEFGFGIGLGRVNELAGESGVADVPGPV